MLLIFPTEVGIDKNKPPILTISMVMIIIGCFFAFQMDDGFKEAELLHYYQSAGLYQTENNHFEIYLETESARKHYRNIKDVKTDPNARQFYMIYDQDFRQYLFRELAKNKQTYDNWEWPSKELEKKKLNITSFAWGARPNQGTYATLITHTFLHGGLGHLFGNMLFLFLFGIGVERLFGKLRFLLIYFATGAAGALLFTFLHGKPFMPLVGASGAISGLMGAYVAYFGFRKIRFLAWIGIYFNYVKWPAFTVLIFWLGKEFFSQLTESESNVAYMAHFGGLAVGGVLGLALRPFKKTREKIEKPDDSSALSQVERDYRKATSFIKKLEIEEAITLLFAVLDKQPNHFEAIKNLYNLVKLNPRHQQYWQVINLTLNFSLKAHDADEFILRAFQESKKNFQTKQLKLNTIFSLCHRFLRNDLVDTAEPLIKDIKENQAENELLPKLLLQWCGALKSRGKFKLARTELNYLANYYGETPHGQAAQQQLSKWRG